MNGSRLSELRDSLLALYECARAMGAHDVAYHALAGALRAAEDLHDHRTLRMVEEQARRHLTLMHGDESGNRELFTELAARALQQEKGRPKAPLRTTES
jgi:hypothetical protein